MNDPQNLTVLYHDLFPDLSIIRTIKSGKEAEVFLCGVPDGKLFALKVYKDPEQRTFRKTDMYTSGRHVKNRSEARAMTGWNIAGKRIAHDKWIRREYYMLEKLSSLGCAIPKVYANRKDTILMEYIGWQDAPPARLSDVVLSVDQAQKTFELILENIHLFFQSGIVHGDLSEYNILYWNNTPYIIDFPQSIDIRSNPYTREFLVRDVQNVCKYFEKYFPIDIEWVCSDFKKLIYTN